ncbi:MAG: asparagine synthase C-terminal domain-containing protein [Pseudomonadota bacterium]|nr:asparagine synthase C-terminal domain-containing protein [Pseudomonadota bacterium]
MRHPGAGSELDPQALFHYLHFHAVPAPAAIYKGQRRLLPGEAVHLQGGRLQRTRYWQLQFHEHGQADPAQLKQEFLDTARHAAQDARGALPAGVLLSGGQGSALIAAMLAGAGAPLRTYAVGYDGGADDSLAHARQLAHQLGAIHRERQVGAADVADAIAQLAALCDQPLGDPALLVPLHGALMAREDGVQRLLGGHGCAELFGARPEYAVQARLSQYEKIPSALRQALVEPLLFQLAGAADAAPLRRARSYIERALVGLPARLAASNLLHEHAGADLFDAGFLASVDPSAPAWLLGQSWSKTERCSQVNQLIALELQYGLADQRLPAMRRACQLAGLEAGFPLLGDAMVAFAARLAPRQKLDGMRRCPFLREALRGSAAHKASAQAAVLPFGLWLHSAPRIRALAFDSLAALKRRAIVRPGFIDALLAAHPAAPAQRHADMVWLLMMLEQWLAQRGAGARPAAPVRRAVDASATCRL